MKNICNRGVLIVFAVALFVFVVKNATQHYLNKTENMNITRAAHTATLLNNGKVLISGGYNFLKPNSRPISLKSTEIYDPQKGKFTLASNMNYERSFHTATLLKDGRILFVGGNGGYDSKSMCDLTTKTAEIYDPKTGAFTLTGNLVIPRERHSATLLKDGRVLIAGGLNTHKLSTHSTGVYYNGKYIPPKYDVKIAILTSAEIYDPKAGKFTLIGDMQVSVGGNTGILNDANFYDLVSGKFISSGKMPIVSGGNTAVLLQDGNVLLASHKNQYTTDHPSYNITKYELYDVSKGRFFPISNHYDKYYSQFNSFILLPNAKVLNYGTGCAEIYDPNTNKSVISGCGLGRTGYTLTLLSNGEILIIGGEVQGMIPQSVDAIEKYNINNKKHSIIGDLNDHRIFHTATLLNNGKVLIAGGRLSGSKVLKSAELH